MHHQDFSGDSSGSRKMSHQPAFHHRRDSSGASASAVGNVGNVIPGDDNPPQAGSSSPGQHHQPQSQALGAQVKKKSGFQITSVTSAQINVSTNSLADDTESYDDMDESHTEDLSSSDILDVSVSKATDTGVTERSSSDETLNSLHGVDTPGLVSPNEPLHPHSIPQASMVNGAVHHQPQQHCHSHSHQHHPESMSGAQLPPSATGGTPSGIPLASSSPIQVPTTGPGPSQSQRLSMLDNTTAAGAAAQTLTTVAPGTGTEMHLPGNVNITNVSAVNALGMPPSGTTGFDSSRVAGQGASVGTGAAPVAVSQAVAAATNTQSQQTQTQAATGSRFRVVKLDTNSEPYRKGRWTCTEYYEKEIPSAATSETSKAVETAAETEQGNGGAAVASPGPTAVQPPQTLQAYQQPSQDFTNPQPMQKPPQVLTQNPPLPQAAVQEVGVGGHMLQQPVVAPPVTRPAAPPQVMAQGTVSQPPAALPQQLPYAVDPHQVQPPVSYSTPQLLAGVVPSGAGRQPDFIQPTAPFQTQVQPPMPHVTPGVSMTVGRGGLALPPVAVTQQLPFQGQTAPPSQATFAPAHPSPAQPPQQQQQKQQLHPQPPQPQTQPPATTPASVAPNQGTLYMPLTTLQADLQPLLTTGMTFSQTSGVTHAHGGAPNAGVGSLTTTQLEDAQRLLFQHQSLLRLPRLGTAAGGEGAGRAAGALVHMGMAAEASALVAAAAGLRTQSADGEDDSSSGASVVAIDNKIEQAMDLVKSHLMYAVREEVEVLKEQIKELIERNSQLEQENNLLKNLASPEQIAQFQAQIQTGGSPTSTAQPPALGPGGTPLALPSSQNSGSSA